MLRLSAVHAQPLHSAASLLAQMERHGIANARTVAPGDEVAEAATAEGEAPDAATMRPRQGSGSSSGKDEAGSTRPVGEAASGASKEADTLEPGAKAESAMRPLDGSTDAGDADRWQLQSPPSSASLPQLERSSGGGASSVASSAPTTGTARMAAPVAMAQEQAAAGGGGSTPVQALPDLGSGFGPPDAPLRRSASDAGGSGSLPPPSGLHAPGPTDSRHGRTGSGELAAGGAGQLRSRSAAPGSAHGSLLPSSVMALSGAALYERCGATATRNLIEF